MSGETTLMRLKGSLKNSVGFLLLLPELTTSYLPNLPYPRRMLLSQFKRGSPFPMTDIKGQHLYVNLSASQVRRRLKGFGHGVRKVQAAGKNRAVVIHTATGQHLKELEAVFGDVTYSSTEEDGQQD